LFCANRKRELPNKLPKIFPAEPAGCQVFLVLVLLVLRGEQGPWREHEKAADEPAEARGKSPQMRWKAI